MRFIKSKKLSTILSIYSLGILIVLNVITAVGMGTLTNYAMSKKEIAYLKQVESNAQKQVEAYINKYVSVIETLADNQEIVDGLVNATKENPITQNPDFKRIVDFLDITKEKYEDIFQIGIGVAKEDAIYLSDGQKLNIIFSERAVYTAVTKNKTFITQPYIDAVTGDMCVSIAAPVEKNGKVVGVIAVDLGLEQLSSMLSQLSFDETGRLLLLSEDNTVIGYNDTSTIGKNVSEIGLSGKEWDAALANPTQDIFSYDFKGEKKVGILVELPEYQWKLLVGLSEKEFYKDTIWNLIALSALLTAGLVISALLLRRVIAKKLSPISQINTCLMEMSYGNLEIDVTHTSEDEIGEMAQSMRSCIHSLSTYIHDIDFVLEGFSNGDLTTNFNTKFKGDFYSIQVSTEKFRRKLDMLLRDITVAAEQVSLSSSQIASGAQELAQGATEQAASVQELVAAVTQVSEQIHTNEENSKATSKQVEDASVALIHCNEQMQELEKVMGEINNQSGKIRNIIKTIEDIAFQTNILALNASVEAARAGTYGKGFAVVANEVGNLSSKSSQASKEITQLIEATINTIEKGLFATDHTAKSLLEVMDKAKESVILVDEIAVASEQQAAAISQIDVGVSQISTVVQSNSATSEQSAAASDELSGQAAVLHDLVSQFELRK